jgi:hypothetical protein
MCKYILYGNTGVSREILPDPYFLWKSEYVFHGNVRIFRQKTPVPFVPLFPRKRKREYVLHGEARIFREQKIVPLYLWMREHILYGNVRIL